MQTSTSNYTYFVQKAIQRKKSQPSRRQSPLKECEDIVVEMEIADECDLEIFLLLNKLPTSIDDALEIDLKSMKQSSRTMFDSFE